MGLAAVALAAGCVVHSPGVNVPNGDLATPPVAMDTFADTVLTYSVNGQVSPVCSNQQPPDCTTTQVQTGACPALVVLGPESDSKPPLTLNAGDSLVVGFMCSAITERGVMLVGNQPTRTADFRIWGSLTGTNPPVVQVSENATDFYPVNIWGEFLGEGTSMPFVDFDLDYTSTSLTIALQVARYVSITQNQGGGTVTINAFESLRAPQ